MRAIVTTLTEALPLPSIAEREAAKRGPASQTEHDRWMAAWPAMTQLECRQPPSGAPGASSIRVAAWNLERCKHVEASAALLAIQGVDLLLATEMDWGCARSAQRHTTADLAAELGLGYVFGVEFVELALGDARETELHRAETNLHGLHGNAVLSRFPVGRAALLPLDDGGIWYVSDLKQGQRRIGGRNAIAAEILAPGGAFWAVAVHLESESTPESRARQTERLIAGLAALAGEAPMVIGGDFNLFDLSRKGLTPAEMMAAPERVEPSFAYFAAAGFDWRKTNTEGSTTRLHPWQAPDKPLLKIDWLFTRGLAASNPWIAPALGAEGQVLSDHEPIGVSVRF